MKREPIQKVKTIIYNAMADARSYDDIELRPEHLISAILLDNNNRCVNVLKKTKGDLDKIMDELSLYLKDVNLTPRLITTSNSLPYSEQTELIFDLLDKECDSLHDLKIDTAHLMLSILSIKTNGGKILKKYGVTYEIFKGKIKDMNDEINGVFNSGFDDGDIPEDFTKKPSGKNKKPTALDNFCKDVSNMVEEGNIDPIVGREKEIKKISQILAKRKKNNPVLIGDPGVGKTAVVEGLAQLINEGKAPRVLLGKRIYSLDLASVVAGTKYRGQFEERMKVILEELTNNKNIILFIDELHTLIGSGNSAGALDGSNIFKPALARGEVQIIGATTLDEFREHIEKDGALTRRFQRILIEEPTLEETKVILENIKVKYEDHHKVTYTDEAIEECVKLTDRYITDRAMPDKAIDILDEAGASVNMSVEPPKEIKKLEEKSAKLVQLKKDVIKAQKYEEAAKLRDQGLKVDDALKGAKKAWVKSLDEERKIVDVNTIAEVVSMTTGIPINKMSTQETKKLLAMDKELLGKVIGQDDAVKKVIRSVKRNRIGIKDKTKPIGSFIFLGPTGVGKCICGDTEIVVRNKITGEIETININNITPNTNKP